MSTAGLGTLTTTGTRIFLAMPPIPQEALGDLVKQFLELYRSGRLERLRQRKWGHSATVVTLIEEERLNALSPEDAELLYRGLPIAQGRRKAFLSNPIQEIRECLWFLLYGEAPYEIRVWELLDDLGGFRLAGTDRQLVSALLCHRDPLLYGLANARVDRALRRLGVFPRFDRKESNAGKFQKVQEALWRIREAARFPDFMATDDFLEALDSGMLEQR